MSVRLENGWYVDDNGNRWSASRYTQTQAELNSASLTDCRNCVDCWGCVDCWYCRRCRNCVNCWDCVDCVNCWGCVGCRDCRDCRDCWDCIGCRDCMDCMGCKNCRGYEKNPARLVGPAMGSRDANPVVYWLEGNVQCVVGCFRGDLDALEQKVRETHANNKEHFDDYMHFIKTAKRIIKEFEK